MNKKEPMSLSEHYNLRYTLNGFVWLIYAIINLLPNNIVTKVLCIVALIMAIITSCIALFVKADADDEMSILHISKAKAMTLDITVSLFLIIGSSWKYGSKYSQVISVRYRSGSTSYWHFILVGRKDE